ncbi:hypothetical protein LY78DRAFT_122549 [Colletotrichum sublineola]|uniref:Uncharacterized protein n=1 Tax=Colletotrichum sublineola TaxID=1173701 RepID=A0A066XAR2_COLSU|nr:hypothetical protein LY78DRAFT_122549 [Colletotrichum sublineola]KDN64709.1 hypothetical protein CSUB01_01923 [Colletotrichum sublineola]
MSGMHSTFSSSVTGDNRHSYALLPALQQGSSTSTGSNATSGSHFQQKGSDAASVSSFGSSVSLLKGTPHGHSSAVSSSSSGSKKSPSLVARQRAAEDVKTGSVFMTGPVRNDL